MFQHQAGRINMPICSSRVWCPTSLLGYAYGSTASWNTILSTDDLYLNFHLTSRLNRRAVRQGLLRQGTDHRDKRFVFTWREPYRKQRLYSDYHKNYRICTFGDRTWCHAEQAKNGNAYVSWPQGVAVKKNTRRRQKCSPLDPRLSYLSMLVQWRCGTEDKACEALYQT